MGSAAQPFIDWRDKLVSLAQKARQVEDSPHPLQELWGMLNFGHQQPPAPADTRQMMNWTPEPNEEQKEQIRRQQMPPVKTRR